MIKTKLNTNRILGFLTAMALILSSNAGFCKTILDEVTVSAKETDTYVDINGDEKINILDMISAKNSIIENKNTLLSSSDMNADGVFNYKDIYELNDYLVGRTDNFSGEVKKSLQNIDRTIINSEKKDSHLQITSEMATLAESLKTPLEIYKYVLNNVNSEFYYGARKGAMGTYEQNGGNDYDQSSLLIALLQHLGYEANYAVAEMKLTDYDLCNLTATSDVNTAKRIFTSQGKSLTMNADGTNTTEEVLVLLTVDGKSYPLDAYFKYYKPNEKSISIDSAAADLGLSDIDEINPYIDYNLDLNATDIFPTTQIIDQGIKALPERVPYSLASNNLSVVSKIPDSQCDIIELYIGNSKLMSYNSAYLYSKDLTIEYELTEDAQFYLNDVYEYNIDSIDDLSDNLGAYAELAQIYGVIKLDGKKIANGNSGLLGDKENLKISVKSASGVTTNYEKELIKGALYSIVFDYQMISPHDIAESYSKLPQDVSAQSKINENNIYGSKCLMNTMSLLGKSYFSQIDTNNEAASQLSDIYYERSISAAVVEFVPDIYTKLGMTMLNKRGKLGIDVLGNAVSFISKSSNTEKESGMYHSTGLLSSFYESQTIKQFTGMNAISTSEVFNIADENNIDILYLSKANINELDTSKLSEKNKADIKAYIEAGNYITVPAEEITVDSWSGTGYIVYNPSTGLSTYIINNNLKGGSLVSWVGLSYLCDICFTVVECTWAFDLIMLGATVLGAGIILFSGPIGAALIISAIGLGIIVAGGFYLKNIGDRFSDATLLMDNYMNGDTQAGEELKHHSLWHGITTGGFMAAGKYLAKDTTAPFFKSWVEQKIGYTASRMFESTSIGATGAGDILMNISPKYADTLINLIEQYGTDVVDSVANMYSEKGGVSKVQQSFENINSNKPLIEKISETDTVNLSGKVVRIPNQNPKDITNSINSRLNNPNAEPGDLIEAKIADYIIKNDLDTVEHFGNKVSNLGTNNTIGDIDIGTSKYLIEAKSSLSSIKSNKIIQFKKYTDMFYKDYFNFNNKKVILYVDREGLNYNDNRIKEIQDMGVTVVNSLEELMEAMK